MVVSCRGFHPAKPLLTTRPRSARKCRRLVHRTPLPHLHAATGSSSGASSSGGGNGSADPCEVSESVVTIRTTTSQQHGLTHTTRVEEIRRTTTTSAPSSPAAATAAAGATWGDAPRRMPGDCRAQQLLCMAEAPPPGSLAAHSLMAKGLGLNMGSLLLGVVLTLGVQFGVALILARQSSSRLARWLLLQQKRWKMFSEGGPVTASSSEFQQPSKQPPDQEQPGAMVLFQDQGETVEWVNMCWRKIWRVYQRGLERWIMDLLQPLFDMLVKETGYVPTFLQRIKIVEFTLDHEAPYFSNMRRRTSRKDSDLSGVVDVRYTGGARMLLMLEVGQGRWKFKVPVMVSDLDLECKMWVKIRLAPICPWLGQISLAFVGPPTVKVQLSPYNRVRLMRIPVLQTFLSKLLTVDLPGLMVLPQRIEINIPPSVTSVAEAAVGRDTIMRAVASAVLEADAAEQALLSALPLGPQTPAGGVTLPEGFCGELTVKLREARELPVWGFPWQSNPYCRLMLGEQAVRSRRDDDTSHEGDHRAPVWNQEFQFLVQDLQREKLEIVVRDSHLTGKPEVGRVSFSLKNLPADGHLDVWLPLEPTPSLPNSKAEGLVRIELTYRSFEEDELDSGYREAELFARTSDGAIKDIQSAAAASSRAAVAASAAAAAIAITRAAAARAAAKAAKAAKAAASGKLSSLNLDSDDDENGSRHPRSPHPPSTATQPQGAQGAGPSAGWQDSLMSSISGMLPGSQGGLPQPPPAATPDAAQQQQQVQVQQEQPPVAARGRPGGPPSPSLEPFFTPGASNGSQPPPPPQDTEPAAARRAAAMAAMEGMTEEQLLRLIASRMPLPQDSSDALAPQGRGPAAPPAGQAAGPGADASGAGTAGAAGAGVPQHGLEQPPPPPPPKQHSHMHAHFNPKSGIVVDIDPGLGEEWPNNGFTSDDVPPPGSLPSDESAEAAGVLHLQQPASLQQPGRSLVGRDDDEEDGGNGHGTGTSNGNGNGSGNGSAANGAAANGHAAGGNGAAAADHSSGSGSEQLPVGVAAGVRQLAAAVSGAAVPTAVGAAVSPAVSPPRQLGGPDRGAQFVPAGDDRWRASVEAQLDSQHSNAVEAAAAQAAAAAAVAVLDRERAAVAASGSSVLASADWADMEPGEAGEGGALVTAAAVDEARLLTVVQQKLLSHGLQAPLPPSNGLAAAAKEVGAAPQGSAGVGSGAGGTPAAGQPAADGQQPPQPPPGSWSWAGVWGNVVTTVQAWLPKGPEQLVEEQRERSRQLTAESAAKRADAGKAPAGGSGGGGQGGQQEGAAAAQEGKRAWWESLPRVSVEVKWPGRGSSEQEKVKQEGGQAPVLGDDAVQDVVIPPDLPLEEIAKEVAKLKQESWRSKEDHVSSLWAKAVERNDRSWIMLLCFLVSTAICLLVFALYRIDTLPSLPTLPM